MHHKQHIKNTAGYSFFFSQNILQLQVIRCALNALILILSEIKDTILYLIEESFSHMCLCFHCPVSPLADYYIIAGVVYQAPDLGTVISSRAVRIFSMIT